MRKKEREEKNKKVMENENIQDKKEPKKGKKKRI